MSRLQGRQSAERRGNYHGANRGIKGTRDEGRGADPENLAMGMRREGGGE